VQIEKQNSSDLAPGSVAGSHDPRIAQRHLIALPARLALMRWTRGGDIPHIPAPGRDVAKRAAWYGRMQEDFQSWLAAGGFHQNEPGQGVPK
jgi:hypothetical protein